ncbi:MAG TPA: DUF4436 family protein [Edaphobacter sp.]|jgi:hypothetical protein
MGIRAKISRLAAVVAVMLVYCTVLWLGLTEESRRSLTIVKSSATDNDFVIANLKITSVDTAQGLLHGRIRLIPMGRFAIDKTTPATNLTLLVNSVSGKQKTVFPKGERIVPIDFSILLSGNQSRYPFDRFTTDIELVITTPAKKKSEPPPDNTLDENADPLATTLIVGASDLDNNEPVPINENFVASIPGIKFEGTVTENSAYKLMQTALEMRRANNVISISLMVMGLMFVLAISIVRMVLTVTASSGAMNLLPLSLSITLIFGLPALRSIQPGVPPVGGFSDYLSFIWAEMMVSISAIALAWTWILRSKKDGT